MASAFNAALVITNLAEAGTLTASSEVTGMGINQLIDSPHVCDDLWRSVGNTANFTLDNGSDVAFDTLSLLGPPGSLTAAATIRVRISTAAAGPTAGNLHDVTYSVADAQFDPNYISFFVLPLAASVAARYVRFDISDTSLSYLQAGKLVEGTREQLAYNFAPGSNFDWNDPSAVQKAQGGQTLVWEKPGFRSVRLDIAWVNNAQRWGLIETLGRVNGRKKPALLIVDPTADNLPQKSIYALMTDMSPAVWTNLTEIYAKPLQFDERR